MRLDRIEFDGESTCPFLFYYTHSLFFIFPYLTVVVIYTTQNESQKKRALVAL